MTTNQLAAFTGSPFNSAHIALGRMQQRGQVRVCGQSAVESDKNGRVYMQPVWESCGGEDDQPNPLHAGSAIVQRAIALRHPLHMAWMDSL